MALQLKSGRNIVDFCRVNGPGLLGALPRILRFDLPSDPAANSIASLALGDISRSATFGASGKWTHNWMMANRMLSLVLVNGEKGGRLIRTGQGAARDPRTQVRRRASDGILTSCRPPRLTPGRRSFTGISESESVRACSKELPWRALEFSSPAIGDRGPSDDAWVDIVIFGGRRPLEHSDWPARGHNPTPHRNQRPTDSLPATSPFRRARARERHSKGGHFEPEHDRPERPGAPR